MTKRINRIRFRFWLWLIRLLGLIVPERLRSDWQQEWEAELRYREALLAQWDKLNWRNKLDLLRRSTSAFVDALWLLPKRWEDEMMQDLRFGVRLLLKQPGVTAVMILVLTLGIGANTAIFSVVNALVFNPLPYRDSQQLMWVTNDFRGSEIIGEDLFLTYQAQAQSFAHLVAYEVGAMTPQGEKEGFQFVMATASLFPALGVTPQLGRVFTAEEDRPGAPRVVVLSHEFWQRRFGGNAALLGQEVLLGDEKHTVIGVLPPGFRFLPERRTGGAIDFYEPLALNPQAMNSPETRILGNVIGRLKSGVTPEQARSELSLLLQHFAQTKGGFPPDHRVVVMPLAERLVGHLRRGLLVLLGAVGLVLLIACANVANLLLARGSVRQKEMAIRAALGAGRKRLMRQMLTESLLLSIIGGAAGLWLAWRGVKALVTFTPEDLLQIRASRVDATVLGFALGLTLVTSVLAGLIPAWQASRLNINETLKDGVRSASFFAHKHGRFVAPGLVVGELALTLVLLIGAGLLINSFLRLRAVDPGYNPKNLLTVGVSLSIEKYKHGSAADKRFHQELQTRLSALPGVRAVSYAEHLPLADDGISPKERLTIVGRPPVPEPQKLLADTYYVGPDYFRTMEIPVRAGRVFTEHDNEQAPLVIVINEAMARRDFVGVAPIGQRILGARKRELTIIGVVADVKHNGLATETEPGFYYCSLQSADSMGNWWVVRTEGDPQQLTTAVRQQITDLEPEHFLYQMTPMEQHLSDSLAPRRFQLWLFSLFAVVALALAAIGVYGVISYSVSRRTHEIGIRMALGAQRLDVLWLVVRQGMILAVIGIAVGLAAASGLTRLMTSLLFNVTATDPVTFAGISLLLLSIAFLAVYLPARRATKVDPMIALRHE